MTDFRATAGATCIPVLAVDFNMPQLKARTGMWHLEVGQRVQVDDHDSIRADALVTAIDRTKGLATLSIVGELRHYEP